jgi:LysR family transcriptional regulator, regulator for bpeEF and oprC
VDAFGEIAVFVRVVERQSFTRAAEALGLTASGVSRIVSRLETRLGVRLIERTTRSLGLTADGADYYERCTRILREIEEADGAIARSPRGVPRGQLRVDAPNAFGRFVIAPAIPQLLDAYPDLSLRLTLRDHLIDPIAEGIDVLIRMAELRESELLHKKLGTMPFIVVASPDYLARHGRPASPDDLHKHRTLAFLTGGQPFVWRFGANGHQFRFLPTGPLQSDSIDVIRSAALAGQGIACFLEPYVRDDIARGDLEVVLREHKQEPITVHALYPKQRATLPKVRVFLEFLEQCMRRGAHVPKLHH